jgi:hypothetical protein
MNCVSLRVLALNRSFFMLNDFQQIKAWSKRTGILLDPRGGREYPALREWYEAMESEVPSYLCHVPGEISQWKRALELDVQQYNNQENQQR